MNPTQEHLSHLSSYVSNIADTVRKMSILDDVLEWAPFPILIGNGSEWYGCTRAFTRLTGWTPSGIRRATASDWNALVHPDDRLEVTQAVCEHPGMDVRLTSRFMCSDGTYRRLRWHWSPPGESGQIVASVTWDYGPA